MVVDSAAVFLSGFAAKISILVRGAGLSETMSRYLIDRIESTPSIEVRSRRVTTGEETYLARPSYEEIEKGIPEVKELFRDTFGI